MRYREANAWGEFYSWERRGRVIQSTCDFCDKKIAHPRFAKAHALMEEHLISEHNVTHNSSLLTPKPKADSVKASPTEGKSNDVPF